MLIGITCPVYLTNHQHERYLDWCTKSIVSKEHDLNFYPVENFVEPGLLPLMYHFDHAYNEIHILKTQGEQSVAKAWNAGIEAAGDVCNYVLVINTDIVFKYNAIDRLVAFAETHQEAVMWTMSEYADLGILDEAAEDENYTEHPHFSCFMVKPDFLRVVGRFDENYSPAYLEDGDMHARLALANLKAYVYGGARFYHFGSRTIKEDRELWAKNGVTFPKNQQYFLSKWGVPPVNDVEQMRKVYYKHPYNESDKQLNYWRPL
jgi:GT2 family glycosyltransferase